MFCVGIKTCILCFLPLHAQVLSFAGELLKLAEDLLKNGLHTAEIIAGYQKAYEKTLEILPTLVVKTVENVRDPVDLKLAIKSVLATKQYGYEDLLSELVVSACQTTMSPTAKFPKLNLDSVRIAKLRGGSLGQSSIVKGMVILRDAEGQVKKAENAKVIVFGCGIEAATTEAKGTVLLKTAAELLNYNKSEERKMEEVNKLLIRRLLSIHMVQSTNSPQSHHSL